MIDSIKVSSLKLICMGFWLLWKVMECEKGSRGAMQLQYNNIIALGAMQRK